MFKGERSLSRTSAGWLGIHLGRFTAVGGNVALDLPLELLDALLHPGIFFDQHLDLGCLLGDLRRLLGVLLQQHLASGLLRHTLSLPNSPSVRQALPTR